LVQYLKGRRKIGRLGDWEIQELQNGVQKELSASLHLCRKNSVLPCDGGQRNSVARIFKRNEGIIKLKKKMAVFHLLLFFLLAIIS
jgi:hypothetical protein